MGNARVKRKEKKIEVLAIVHRQASNIGARVGDRVRNDFVFRLRKVVEHGCHAREGCGRISIVIRERHPALSNDDLVLVTHFIRIRIAVFGQRLLHNSQWFVRYGYDTAFMHGHPFACIFGEQFIPHRPVIQAVLLKPFFNNLSFMTHHKA